jgi:hypothetical protein
MWLNSWWQSWYIPCDVGRLGVMYDHVKEDIGFGCNSIIQLIICCGFSIAAIFYVFFVMLSVEQMMYH